MQTQTIVEVQFKGGRASSFISTNGNAAWICDCGTMDPILGRSALNQSDPDGFYIDCPVCSRKYFVKSGKKGVDELFQFFELD